MSTITCDVPVDMFLFLTGKTDVCPDFKVRYTQAIGRSYNHHRHAEYKFRDGAMVDAAWEKSGVYVDGTTQRGEMTCAEIPMTAAEIRDFLISKAQEWNGSGCPELYEIKSTVYGKIAYWGKRDWDRVLQI